MNSVKALLLGSAAGLCAIAGAHAADLPMKKAAPVEYVKVCTAYGPGFFYIPGTDTCIRIGGRARFEYQYSAPLKNEASDRSSYRGLGRLQVDARTATEWGALRTFVRFEIASRTGGWPLRSGTQERVAGAFYATGVDTYGRAQKYVEADKAFIQFAGLTAGRFSSFYDFYGHELELIGASASSELQSTNGIAYTAKLGNGFSATISVEDPTFRRQPLYFSTSSYTNQAPGSFIPSNLTNIPYLGATFSSGVGLTTNTLGYTTSYARVDIAQRNNVPDVVGVLRYDGGWGSAQVSAAMHQISIGNFQSTTVSGATISSSGSIAAATSGVYSGYSTTSAYATANGLSGSRPDAAYGFAVQGGVKFNLPMIAPGDQLWLQASFGRGAMGYTGVTALCGGESPTCQNLGRYALSTNDGWIDANGNIKLSQSWSVVASFLHYWTPTIRQAIFGSYSAVDYGSGARAANGPLYAGLGGSLVPANGVFTAQQYVNYTFSPTMKDWTMFYLGTNLVWSPVKGLDIGAEVSYAQTNPNGRVVNGNKNGMTVAVNGVNYPMTTSTDYVWQTRLRVQRDF